jgi:hypothetical protein
VSLLEVLISMFIILFGLLGVAALLEVGRSEVGVAARQDRALACGASGLADARTRQFPDSTGRYHFMANPYLWQEAKTGLSQKYGPHDDLGGTTHNDSVDARLAFCVDPLYVAENSSGSGGSYTVSGSIDVFPFRDQSLSNPSGYMNTANRMARVTCLPRSPNAPYSLLSTDSAIHRAYFDRFFRWPDDQVFDLPRDPQQRPQRQFDSATNLAEFDGNYTWLVTVTPTSSPDFTESGTSIPFYDLQGPHSYKVSVAVFYKRDFQPPPTTFDGAYEAPERLVWADVTGGGYGGGDVHLRIQMSDMTEDQARAYLNVREGEWLMLCGADAAGATARQLFNWYRIVAAGDFSTDTTNNYWYRNVTLAGPDWASAVQTAAALFTGIVAVYPDPGLIED